MAADDVAKALMAMDDEVLRVRVAGGDLIGLGELDLSQDERALVRSAAADDSEISGYLLHGEVGTGIQFDPTNPTGLGAATSYAQNGVGPTLSASFGEWAAIKRAQGGRW